jgi:hypothetical protein
VNANSDTHDPGSVRYLDPEDSSQQFAPSAAAKGDITSAAWIRYADGEESIVTGLFDTATSAALGSAIVLDSAQSPHLPKTDFLENNPVVFWIADSEGKAVDGSVFSRQQIRYSIRENEMWSDPSVLVTEDTILSFDVASSDDAVWITWCSSTAGAIETIYVTGFTGTQNVDAIAIERGTGLNRPTVAADESGCVVLYDAYTNGTFGIRSAFISAEAKAPTTSEIVVHDDAVRQLSPTATYDDEGNVWSVWLTLNDVADKHGIVDQRPTIRGAIYRRGKWRKVDNPDGSFDLADLSWGLLSFNGAAVWGYLGRRRKPILVSASAGDGVTLMWERKIDHDGSTAVAGGSLCQRHLRQTENRIEVSETEIVAAGPRGYEAIRESRRGSEDPSQRREAIRFTGRAAPEDSTDKLILGTTTFPSSFTEHGTWDNWKPVVVSELISTKAFKRTDAIDAQDTLETRATQAEFPINHQNKAPYWADLHVHTGLSADAEGYVDEIVYYAKDRAGLDVVLLQDNDHYKLSLTNSEYDHMQRRAERFSEDERFVVIPGYEWTYFEGPNATPSHRTIFGRSVDFPMLRNTEAGTSPAESLVRFADDNDAIVHIHHERFTLLPESTDCNMEVCSGWKLHMADPEDREYFHSLLREGNHIGFVGGSDNHRRNPGAGGALTGIFADRLDRKSIIAAIEKHRCFVTNGARIIPRLEINDAFIGSVTQISKTADVRMSVEGAKPDSVLHLYRNGEIIFQARTSGESTSFECADTEAGPGEYFYYLEVVEDSTWKDHASNLAPAVGGMAWTSPIWVTRV